MVGKFNFVWWLLHCQWVSEQFHRWAHESKIQPSELVSTAKICSSQPVSQGPAGSSLLWAAHDLSFFVILVYKTASFYWSKFSFCVFLDFRWRKNNHGHGGEARWRRWSTTSMKRKESQLGSVLFVGQSIFTNLNPLQPTSTYFNLLQPTWKKKYQLQLTSTNFNPPLHNFNNL